MAIPAEPTALPVRDRATRTADSLALLRKPGVDAWVATSAATGVPYLVPLTPAWLDGNRVLLATSSSSRTARNLEATNAAQLAFGATRDVVLVDTVLDRVVPVADDAELGEAYVKQADWDPRDAPGYVFVLLRARRIRAWRNEAETTGATLMRDGVWLDT